MAIDNIVAAVADDFKAVDDIIRGQLGSNVPFIEKIGDYIIGSGGKRIRPLVTLLSARACGYTGNKHLTIAAVVEFLHTATLLHDDVVDGSDLRRGRATVNAVWGNSPSILVGDFLISRAFQMVVSIKNMGVLEVLSNATNQIAEGEVLQLLNCHNPDTTETQYNEVIRLKTAKMFEAASECGAIIASTPPKTIEALAKYALHLGNAFQLVDDVLDYAGDPEKTGKNIGDDLAEGKPTLPLIYALKHAPEKDAEIIREAIKPNTPHTHRIAQTKEVLAIVKACGATDYVEARAKQESQKAIEQLNILPNTPYKEAMATLATSSIERTH